MHATTTETSSEDTLVLTSNIRYSGRVKFFNSRKGFGFIIPFVSIKLECQNEETHLNEIFVHHSEIQSYQRFKSLGDGELVEFNLVKGPNGYQAASVSGPNYSYVFGARKKKPHFTISTYFPMDANIQYSPYICGYYPCHVPGYLEALELSNPDSSCLSPSDSNGYYTSSSEQANFLNGDESGCGLTSSSEDEFCR